MKKLASVLCLVILNLSFCTAVFAGGSCSLAPTPSFYCKDSLGNVSGPYQDTGCSISCRGAMQPVCTPARCDSFFGTGFTSSCSCKRHSGFETELNANLNNETNSFEKETNINEIASLPPGFFECSGRCSDQYNSCTKMCSSGSGWFQCTGRCSDYYHQCARQCK